jgi:sulfatase modifying factor 1
VHTSTGQPPLQRWLAGAPFAQPTPAQLREAFLWAQDRLVRKTATVSLFGNAYEVDPFLVGRRVELVFDPFDLTHIEVRHNGKPVGLATPQDIGRHVHRRARPDRPDKPAAATGIDYLHLVDRLEPKDPAVRRRRSSVPGVEKGLEYDRLLVDANAESLMIAVAPGQLTLSDRRTQHRWSVELERYELGAFPITQARYALVTGERPGAIRGDQLPVEGVSWWDAVRFCNSLSQREGLTPAYQLHAGGEDIEWDLSADGYRLPTEAEWEYACRAGTTGPRYGPLDEIAWYRGNSQERIHEVGGKQPNAWGLYDMLGNVWDWCWDIYDAEVYGTYRVLRGGGWFDEHWSCRASVRRRSHPTFRVDDVGFRVARSAPR